MIVKTSYANWEATGLFNSDGLFTVFLYKDGKVQDGTVILPSIDHMSTLWKTETEVMKCLERAILSDSTNSPKSDISVSSSTPSMKQNC